MIDSLSDSWVPLPHLLTLHLASVPLSLFWNTNKENIDPLGKWSRGANCSHTSLSHCSITSWLQKKHRLTCLLSASSHSSGLQQRSVTTHYREVSCYTVRDKLLHRRKKGRTSTLLWVWIWCYSSEKVPSLTPTMTHSGLCAAREERLHCYKW